MCFIDKIMVISLGFVLGLITTSGFVVNVPDNIYHTMSAKSFNTVFNGGTQKPDYNYTTEELKCDSTSDTSNVKLNDLSDVLMDNDSSSQEPALYKNDNATAKFVTGY